MKTRWAFAIVACLALALLTLPADPWHDIAAASGLAPAAGAVCPANAIKLDTSGVYGHGSPYIVASESPCVACEGLHCMQNCPSGALVFTPLAEIDMGTATWHEHLCVRSRGEDCRLCVDQCPLGSAAITLDGYRVNVIESGCIGCGVCEHYCPTTPDKAIVVIPKASRESGTISQS